MRPYRVDYTYHTGNRPESGHETVTADSPEQAKRKFYDSRAYPIDYDVDSVREI